MARSRDIVANHTIIEVVSGDLLGMRGWLRDIDWPDDDSEPIAKLELVGTNEPLFAGLPLDAIRPADLDTIGTGDG